MNRLIGIVFITLGCVTSVLAQKQPSINPASVYHLSGVIIVSPNQPGWILLQSNKSLIQFQKRGEGEVVNASVKTFRTKVFDKFPRTGIPDYFESIEAYDRYVKLLIKTNCIDNAKKIWWDLRVHPFFNTVEFRICGNLSKTFVRKDL